MTNTIRAAALALVALLCAGCFPQPPELAPFTGPESDVVVFGDSLTAWARAETLPRFTRSVSYNAVGGTQIDHWSAAMANVPPGSTVVVALGTNDVTNDLMAQIHLDVDAALETLRPASCVVWVTVNQFGALGRGWPYDVRTHDLDVYLRQLVIDGTYPNLVLSEWSIAANGHGEYLVDDGVHHTDAGNLAYATQLAAAPELCP